MQLTCGASKQQLSQRPQTRLQRLICEWSAVKYRVLESCQRDRSVLVNGDFSYQSYRGIPALLASSQMQHVVLNRQRRENVVRRLEYAASVCIRG